MKVILALALLPFANAGARRYDVAAQVNMKDTAVSSIEAVNLGGTIETQLRDQLRVGGQYDATQENKMKPKSIFATWNSKEGNPMEVRAQYNVHANSAEVQMDYEQSGTRMEVELDTAQPQWLARVGLSRNMQAKGRDMKMSPAYDFKTNTASLDSRLSLNADTDVELHLESNEIASRDAMEARLTVEHNINANNKIKPVFALKTGDVNYEYTRKLGDDAEMNVNVNPGHDINVAWEDQGSRGLWTTNVNMPWGNARGSKVSVQRKFEL